MAFLSGSARLCLALAGLRALAWAAAPFVIDAPPGEYQVKAAFLLNFARYVDWPPDSFGSPSDPIAICILGQDPMGRLLDDAVGGKTVESHSLTVRRIAQIREAAACHIVFVAASPKISREALASLSMPGVLTVGESEGFARQGGIIGFRVEDERHIRFDVNLDAAREAHLRISSHLLSLATIVKR
jgi:hypothetical protein